MPVVQAADVRPAIPVPVSGSRVRSPPTVACAVPLGEGCMRRLCYQVDEYR